ncbi:MAG: type IV pilus modification PilV family protein [Planctomycetota bacterium]|jgi:hypothetical protein
MRKEGRLKDGFSLTEVLLAVGTLAVGMILVAGAFPVGIHFTTVATERTMAAVVADEAFAKIRMIAAGPNTVVGGDANLPLVTAENFEFDESRSFELLVDDILAPLPRLDDNWFAYPSLDEVAWEAKSYFWSAICRRTRPEGEGVSAIQATVFVCRKVGGDWQSYWFRLPHNDALDQHSWPRSMYFGVSRMEEAELMIDELDSRPDTPDEKAFINDGYMIVDDMTGDIYRVLERRVDNPATGIDESSIIVLDRRWMGENEQRIWAVPAVRGSGRYPCIAVYQKILRF